MNASARNNPRIRRTGLLLAVAAVALLSSGVPLLARQQGGAAVGKEATVPAPPPEPRRFILNYEGANRYLIRDGDPKVEDAPYVLAVAGGAKLWFDDYFLTAQNILVWVDPESLGNGSSGAGGAPESDTFPYVVEAPIEDRPDATTAFATETKVAGLPPEMTSGKVREVYAEGDVYITQGKSRVFQGDKAYFNVIEDRSIIINGEIRTDLSSLSLDPTSQEAGKSSADAGDPARGAPVTIRAAEIRGVSKGLIEADNASVTTSTFAKPGYHIAMDKMIYEERVQEIGGKLTGYGNKFVLGDVPLLELPYFTIRTGVDSPIPLIGFSTGISSRFGAFVETRWGNVFEDLGNQVNQKLGIDGTFSGKWYVDVNLYSARGLGVGGGVTYETRDKYFGLTEFFTIYDYSGDDETERKDDDEDYAGFRGHFRTQNRFFLPDGWQFDSEINYVSDRGFLREFKEDLHEKEKSPETVAYLKKLDGDTAVTGLARYRLNSWQTQTEYLPQATYDVVSRPIMEFEDFAESLGQPEPVRLYWTHRSEVAYVNRQNGDDDRGKDRDDDKEGSAFRIDNIDRFNMPFEVNDFGFDPYVENRLTAWFGDGERNGGGAFREGLTFGANVNTQYTMTDPDVESEYWNIHGIRHIVIPTLRNRFTVLSTVEADDLVPYDQVEFFDTLAAIVPGVTSRYQTKRMTRNGPETVNFLELEVQQPFILHNNRVDDNDLLGALHFEGRYRPDLDHYLLRHSFFRTSFDFNWNEAEFDTFRVEFRTEPGPDFYSRIAYSYAQRGNVSPTLALEGFPPKDRKDEPNNNLTLEFGYQATRLWEFVVVEQIDFSGGGGGETRLLVRRRTADWMFEFGVGAGSSSGIGLSVTPIAFFQKGERDRFQSALSDGFDLSPVFDEPLYSSGRAFEGEPEPVKPQFP